MIIKYSILNEKPKSYPGLWLSVSKVKCFQKCPAQYRFNYIEHLPTKVWAHHTFGNFLHEILEDFHQDIISGNNEPWNEIMTKKFAEVSKKMAKDLTKDQRIEAQSILSHYLRLMSDKKKQDKLPKVIEVESNFYVDINGEVLLNGFIDRKQIDPDNVLHVSDYKTTKNKKYLKNDYFQLLTYAYVMCLQDKDLEKVRASYMLLRHDFETIDKTYTRKELMSVGKEYLECAEQINNEKLWRPKTSFLCNYCDFKSYCKDGKDAVEKINPTEFGVSNW